MRLDQIAVLRNRVPQCDSFASLPGRDDFMYFTMIQTCSANTCGKSFDVGIESPAVLAPDTSYTAKCPQCKKSVDFPAAALHEVNALPANAVASERTALKLLLVVDDEEALRDSLSTILSLEGFSVKTCSSRDNALDILTHETTALIIIDWNMPGMKLEQFVELVRQRYGALPMVLFSTAPNASETAKALSIPCLAKNTAPRELISTIRRLSR
jgi:CheY-like chemotaxis protein